jgi:hypothetical protein
MARRKEMNERRKHTRFQVQNGALAVLTAPSYPHSTERLGQITDMGMGGLAFSYIASEEPSNGLVQLTIVLAGNSFHLPKIAFETISDFETNGVPLSSIKMRRCGVQFGDLTPNQMSKLEYFIRNHSIG